MKRRTINLSKVDTLVLDEADQMFDMGFFPSIRQFWLFYQKTDKAFSSQQLCRTRIKALASEKCCKTQKTVQIERATPIHTVEQFILPIKPAIKERPLLVHLLSDLTPDESVLILLATKT